MSPEKQILRQGLGFRLFGKWSQGAQVRKQGKRDQESKMPIQGSISSSLLWVTAAWSWVPGGPWLKSISLEDGKVAASILFPIGLKFASVGINAPLAFWVVSGSSQMMPGGDRETHRTEKKRGLGAWVGRLAHAGTAHFSCKLRWVPEIWDKASKHLLRWYVHLNCLGGNSSGQLGALLISSHLSWAFGKKILFIPFDSIWFFHLLDKSGEKQ